MYGLKTLLNEDQVAEHLGVYPHTLARLRRAGNGPAYVRFGAYFICYRPEDVEAWLAEKVVQPATVRQQRQQRLYRRERQVAVALGFFALGLRAAGVEPTYERTKQIRDTVRQKLFGTAELEAAD
jgi:hypothetical protein